MKKQIKKAVLTAMFCVILGGVLLTAYKRTHKKYCDIMNIEASQEMQHFKTYAFHCLEK